MRTAAIEQQLAQEHAQLAEAQADATHAAEQLAKDPSSQKLRIAMVEAQQAVAEVQIGIDALNAARVEAVKYDASDEAQAIRKQRAKAAGDIKGHHEYMAQAAGQVDEALAHLKQALGAFRVHHIDAVRASLVYTGLLELDAMTQATKAHAINAIGHQVTCAVAKGVIDALETSKLPDLSLYVTVDHFNRPAHARTMLEAVEVLTRSASNQLDEWEQRND